MEKEPITISGLEKLKDELIFLKEKKRPEIVAAISEASSHGDLKENERGWLKYIKDFHCSPCPTTYDGSTKDTLDDKEYTNIYKINNSY